ncbi:MAG: peptidoglycan DD-metalloendopeptidase family protein [Bacteroidaceae bacterium]|nr:peptidoglycan DD-metalloendopeptidase family protein [Bacteroidaceae bacterium]
MMKNRILWGFLAVALLAAVVTFLLWRSTASPAEEEVVPADSVSVAMPVLKYGLPIEQYNVKYDTLRPRQTLAEVLFSFGFTAQQIHTLVQCPDSIFDARRLRPGQACALLCAKDSATTPRYFVYEESVKEYVVFDLLNNYAAVRGKNPAEWRTAEVAGVVNSSLWVAMQESNASPQLAVLLSHIFGWSIDFFGIQKGDEFRLIYSQEYVEEKPLNNFRIEAASFRASDSTVYAIPFVQDGEELFYNADGNSLEGAFLKAPLDYYRISSRFSNSRFHPVLKRYRAHHGVDYAAPKGTPVYAVGSGKVIAKAYQAGGGGNYVKIRHNSTYVTTYMHLSRFAKGLKVGDAVKQKQVIGYVGSTGISTGPHLDFRVHENGKPINPLTIKSQPKKPISEANKPAFNVVCDSLVGRLKGIRIATLPADSLAADTVLYN